MDIMTLGEALIDFFAVESGKKLSDVCAFQRVPGGAPANVAVGCAKLGVRSSFIGRVGADCFGFFLRDVLSSNGVDTSLMQFDKEARTGLAFISVPTPTSREFLFYRNPSADMMLSYEEFDKEKISKAKVFHFGSISLITHPSREATLKAVETAKSAGSTISYDPNLRIDLWPDEGLAKKTIQEVISLSDIIKLNDDELHFIFGQCDLENGLKELLSMGPKLCVMTMGAQGSMYATGHYMGAVPTFLEITAVDTTGCGDSFVSALLTGIVHHGLADVLKNEDLLIKIVQTASAAATLTSTKKGVIPALPTKAEVASFLEEQL